MTKDVLILIDCDPRVDRRGAEAVRVGAGVGAWKKVRINLYLRGPAILALDEFAEDYPDGLHFAEYLPAFTQHGGTIYVEAGSPFLREITTTLQFEEVDAAELSALLLRFPCAWRI